MFLAFWKKDECGQSRGVSCIPDRSNSPVRRPIVTWAFRLWGGFLEIEKCFRRQSKRSQPIRKYTMNLDLIAEIERAIWRHLKASLREGRTQQDPTGCYHGRTTHERQETLRLKCRSARALAGHRLPREALAIIPHQCIGHRPHRSPR
jgi:hypothetical protein